MATEFPPQVGGMEQHASGLAGALCADHDVVVYTKNEYAGHPYCAVPYDVVPILGAHVASDVAVLKRAKVDAWLVLNAAYACIAPELDAPVFVYCHGNDFLNPWVETLGTVERKCVSALEGLPYWWRTARPFRGALARKSIERGLDSSQMIFVNSRYTRERLREIFPSLTTAIEVSHPGVSDIFFSEPASVIESTRDNSVLRLLTIARLSSSARKKNVEGVLRALAMIAGEVRFSYTIAGDGDLRPRLQELAVHLGISAATKFVGSVTSEQVIRFMDASDLFVLPSRASPVDVESFGIVYAEAAARGLPSLISRSGGSTEAVADGLSGIIIDGAAPDDIADGIRTFLRTRAYFDGDAIKEYAERFRWPRIAARLTAHMQTSAVDARAEAVQG